MIDETELETLLAKSTPLPCSIDSMELMFAAGVEQQKRLSRRSNRITIALGALASALVVSTVILGWMTANLSSENSKLAASISEFRDARNRSGFDQTGLPEQPTLVGIQESGPDPMEPDETEFELTQVSRATDFVRESPLISNLMQRGVALSQWDQYKDPVDGFRSPKSRSNKRSTQVANPYHQLRRELQGSLPGTFEGL